MQILNLGIVSSQRPGASDIFNRNVTSVGAISSRTVNLGTIFESVVASLPSFVTVTLNDGSSTVLVIDWDDQGSYDGDVAATYVLEGTLVEVTGITNLSDLKATVSITVNPAQEFSHYVSLTGDDTSGTGSSSAPWRTFTKACSVAVAGETIKGEAGDFEEAGCLIIPEGVSIVGSGIDQTIITINASQNYGPINYTDPLSPNYFNYGFDKYAIQLTSITNQSGNQTFKDFTLGGNSRGMIGGFYVNNRNGVVIQGVKFEDFGWTGTYLVNSNSCRLIDNIYIDCASTHQSLNSAAIMFGTCTDLQIEHMAMNMDVGVGIKAYSTTSTKPTIAGLIIKNGSVSVPSSSLLGDGSQINFAIDLNDAYLVNCEIFNNPEIDSAISYVRPLNQVSNGIPTLKVYGNKFDMESRNGGLPYCLNLNGHDVEVFSNHFKGGSLATIANWAVGENQPAFNWSIHHNTFVAPQNPTQASFIIRSRFTGIRNLNFYNNTVHINHNRSVHVLGTENGQVSSNINFINNIVLDESTADADPSQGGPNQLYALINGGSVTNFFVHFNYIHGIPVGSIAGASYSNNSTLNPNLTGGSAISPDPYYRPRLGSGVVGSGVNVGLPFTGLAPTIGAYELAGVSTAAIESVDPIDDRVVSLNIPFASLGLPEVATVTLDTGEEIDLPVTWDEGTYDETDEGIHSLVGDLTLPTGITNPDLLTAAITIIVGTPEFAIEDTFDRFTLGPDYTVTGTSAFTQTLDGSSLLFDGLDGVFGQRITRNDSLVDINNLSIKAYYECVEVSPNSFGWGVGIQNLVNPDPNKAVLLSVYASSNSDAGSVSILSGNGTTNPNGFTLQRLSTTQIPIAVGNIYEVTFQRIISAGDAIFTATVKNVATEATVSVTWTEVGAGSMFYIGTSKIEFYHFGGLQKLLSYTVQDLDIENPFPNVVSVQSVSPITVANGTAFGSIGLPATRTVTLSDGTTPSYNIVWTGSYSPTTAGVYNLTGTITLPIGVTNTSNVVVTAAVTVQAPTSAFVFTYYSNWDLGNDTTGNGSIGNPWKSINKAASVMVPGDSLGIRGSSDPNNPMKYRECFTPVNSGTASNKISYLQYPGEYSEVTGLDEIANTGWTVDVGNIYKKTIAPPVDGYQVPGTMTNTTILQNQIFRNGSMMFEASWPKKSTEADLLDFSKMRHHSQGIHSRVRGFNFTSIVDNGLSASVGSGGAGLTAGALTGARLITFGWFWNHQRIISSHNVANTINFPSFSSDNDDGCRYRKWWYVTGKRALLTQENEWHWDGSTNTLYLWQSGGGTPSGTIEYKARNWGADLAGKSNITIAGIRFKGCEINGNTSTSNIIVDNIRASYINHCGFWSPDGFPGYGNATRTGFKLIGSNNTIKNSEIQYAGGAGVWLGQAGRMENCKIRDINYEGGWGAPAMGWQSSGNIVITRNTFQRTGRSAIDVGNSYVAGGTTQSAMNWDMSYNDISGWGMVNIDLGAIYSWGFRNNTGCVIHHNWFHADGVKHDPTGAKLDGGQRCTYFDQASGPYLIHHNVYFDCFGNLQDSADAYNQMHFEHRIAGSSRYYNNTMVTGAPHTYTTYENGPKDIFRNNIFLERLNINWGGGNAPDEQNNVFVVDNVTRTAAQTSAGTSFLGTNSVRNAGNQFVGGIAGTNGLDFLLLESTEARGRAVAIPEIGIAAGDDCGAYQYGDPNPWVPGYNEVPYFTPDPVDPGTVDIDSIDTVVNDFDAVYNTAFGTNGAGLGLPQTIDVTFDDLTTGTLDVTWTGTYSPTASPWDDIVYTLTGTPVLVGDITNDGSLTLSVDVTRKSMLAPIAPAGGTVKAVRDPAGLVNNTTNSYGIVASDVVTQWDNYGGNANMDMIQSGTGPTLSGGMLVFTGTQKMRQTVDNTDFEFMHYKANPADLKWIVLKVLNITNTGALGMLIGNNGYYEGNRGIGIAINTSAGAATISLKIGNGSGSNAVLVGHNSVFTPGTKFLLTNRFDNNLLASAGKNKVYNNTTVINATSSGSGTFSNSAAPSDPMENGNAGAAAGYNFQGSMGAEIIIEGSVSDAVLLKLQQDLMAYSGIS